MKVALIGCNGFVGNFIKRSLLKPDNESIFISRENYSEHMKDNFDVVINAAMPSKRFWAKKNPELDYIETVEKTKKIINDWNFKKLIQISSVSARCQINTTYGKNKSESEQLCKNLERYLILRLGPMYGPSLSKGVLIDLKQDKEVFVSGNSKYSFTDVDWIGSWISKNLDKNGLYEIGASDFIKLSDLASKINSKSVFSGDIDDQLILNFFDYPGSSSDVVRYLKE